MSRKNTGAERARLDMEREYHELLYDVRVHLKGATHWSYEQREYDLRHAHEILGKALHLLETYREDYCLC